MGLLEVGEILSARPAGIGDRGRAIEVTAHDTFCMTARGVDGGINRVLRVGLRGEGSHCTGLFFLANSTLSVDEKMLLSLRRMFDGTHR